VKNNLKQMVENKTGLPVYAKISLILIGIFVSGFLLYVGQGILLPLLYSFLFAIQLDPLVLFFERLRIPRILAITIAIILAITAVIGLVYFISSEVATFSTTLPQFREKLMLYILQLKKWISEELHISPDQVQSYLIRMRQSVMNSSNEIIGQTLSTVSGLLIVILLIPVYIFMILYYKPLLLGFLEKVFDKSDHHTVSEVVLSCNKMIQNYLAGLLLEALIVASMNSVGLLLIGIEYAFLLGIIGALLNIIPFIGGILAVSLPLLVAIVTKETITPAILVIALYLIVQFIDNHYIIPKIVASRVKINALATVIVVLISGALWGIAGMFVAIPMTAIIKIIFDNIESLKPWGFLLGDEMPVFGKYSEKIKKQIKSKI
jgi:predicted PurR-regulated permease PerM